jgi:hypothetical protein
MADTTYSAAGTSASAPVSLFAQMRNRALAAAVGIGLDGVLHRKLFFLLRDSALAAAEAVRSEEGGAEPPAAIYPQGGGGGGGSSGGSTGSGGGGGGGGGSSSGGRNVRAPTPPLPLRVPHQPSALLAVEKAVLGFMASGLLECKLPATYDGTQRRRTYQLSELFDLSHDTLGCPKYVKLARTSSAAKDTASLRGVLDAFYEREFLKSLSETERRPTFAGKRAHLPEVYASWNAAAQAAAFNISGSWKADKSIKYMLEHVDTSLGEGHLKALRGQFGLPDAEIQRLCNVNDARGGAELRDIGGLRVTGVSLRYLHHAMLMLATSASWERIVEVGGGYGGLACIVAAVAAKFGRSIASYRIYDLPGPAQLQRAFLGSTGLRAEWGDPASFGADMGEASADLLVSCYAVSELDKVRREGYLRELLPRCGKVFLAWNTADRCALLPQDKYAMVPEEPISADGNVIITRLD